MARDNFYGVNITEDRWNEIFGKKEPNPSRMCECGHPRSQHADNRFTGDQLACNSCECKGFKEKI